MKPLLLILSLLLPIYPLGARPEAWMEPFPPHKIAGNLYYVGSKDLASYLIATPEGHILINSSFEESVPLIRASIEKLGYGIYEELDPALLPKVYVAYTTKLSEGTEVFHNDIRGRWNRGA